MRFALAAILGIHGMAHLVGFAVPWRLLSSPELPYKTTILAGRLDVGAAGIRLVGVLWLLTALAFAVAATASALRLSWALPFIVVLALASLVLCAAEWPQARLGLFVNVALLVASPVLGSLAWREASTDAHRQLAVVTPAGPRLSASRHFDQLPPPVARYFRRVLQDGQLDVRGADLVQEAEFFVGNAWRPLRATQRFTLDPPGFVWDARIDMAPLMPVYVRDAYIGGAGSMRGEFLGLYPIVNQRGKRELDAGALLRYLAEAVWFPTALLPSEHLRWDALDDQAARATLTDAHTTVSAEFRFNDAGDIVEIFAPDRLREVDGKYEPTPWLVRCFDYQERSGLRIPVRCEVAWQLPSGSLPYWRGRIVQVQYDLAD